MKRLILVASAKGGSGKSYTSRALIDLIRLSGRSVSVWDGDSGTGSVARIYPDRNPEVGAGVEDVRSPEAPGRWLEAIYTEVDDIIVDVPGGALSSLVRVVEGGAPTLIAETQAAGRQIVVASVIGIKFDSSTAPQEAIKLFGSGARHVVVKNGFWGKPDAFVVYEGMTLENGSRRFGKTAAAVREVGGEEVYFPPLNSMTDVLLDVEGMSFAAACEAIATLGRRHTINSRIWLGSVEEAFAGSWLDTSGAVPVASNGKAGRGAAVKAGG